MSSHPSTKLQFHWRRRIVSPNHPSPLHYHPHILTTPHSCCPSNTFCQYADNKQVGCCSALQGNCKGSLSGGNAYQSTSQYIAPAATTTWATSQVATQYVGGAVGNYNPTTTVVQQGGFCTTIIAQGDNLPTIANARCGTALVVEAGASRSKGREMVVGVVVGLQILGGWVVLRRW
jgi:hypothetical protein